MKKEIIAARIKAERERQGMSQAELGFIALGYNKDSYNAAQQKIRKIESGIQNAKLDELLKIFTALHIPLDELHKEDTPFPPLPTSQPPAYSSAAHETAIAALRAVNQQYDRIAELEKNIESRLGRLSERVTNLEKISHESQASPVIAGDRILRDTGT